MICRRCDVDMVEDIGPRDEPGPYGCVVDHVERCPNCGREWAVHVETWTPAEIRRRIAIVRGRAVA